ncbi:MAG: hypothetical protein JJU02_13440 [Cryomorphaceae bacterium]|nr:hypothetical protein [Cryomorphaceae bacterium]
MKEQTERNLTWFDKQAIGFDKSRFGLMTIFLTAQSCFGSIAAMFALQAGHPILLGVCVAVTMSSNAAFLAQSPAKWCLGLFYTSIITNFLILILTI